MNDDAGVVTAQAADDPGTILVVEDDPVGRRTLELAVTRLGHRVLTATEGNEALAAMREGVPDLVLLDLVMPGLDGFGVLDAMRADPALSSVPVVVISAVEDTEQIAGAIEMGAVDCLPKPFDPVLLQVRVRMALQQGRLRRLEQDYLRQELELRQNERLAAIGRLSAGLAHELNNPAGAALRTVRQMVENLDETQMLLELTAANPDAGAILTASRNMLAGRGDAPVAPLEAADLAAEVEDILAPYGLSDRASLADRLVAAGVRPGDLGAALEGFDAVGVELVLRLMASRGAIRDGMRRVLQSIERISAIIASFRSYTYLDQAPRQEIDVRDGIADTLAMFGSQIKSGVVVVREDEGVLPKVAARGPQLNQVWTNLIDNALHALAGSGTLTIRTRAVSLADGQAVVVEVEDDGPGIPPGIVNNVFDPFVTTKEPGEGTGLGLSITHQYVTEGHRGRIEVASEPGRTVFTVTLPAAGG
jgi:signal transduction histidine kinase